MEYRIDGAVIPPGLVKSAKSFSLILRDEGLYIIHTGPANDQWLTKPIRRKGVIRKVAVEATENIVNQRIDKKVTEEESRLSAKGPDALIQKKHCKLLTPNQILEINIKENLREIVLDIRSSQGNYKFRLPIEDRTVAETIKQMLRP